MITVVVACTVCGKPFDSPAKLDGTPYNSTCSFKCARIQGGRTRKQRNPPVEHICPVCGKTFTSNPARKRTFCSYKCMGESKRKPPNVIWRHCDYCGKKFSQPNPENWKTHAPQRFCSVTCIGKGVAQERGLHIRKPVTFTCEHCGKPFTRMARADREYHFCSRACYWAERRGNNHHCWKGGTDHYYGPNWDEQRLKALERDNYTCQECGIREDRMSVHHIVPRSEFNQDWEAMNDLSNLVTLCGSCHTRLHMTLPDN